MGDLFGGLSSSNMFNRDRVWLANNWAIPSSSTAISTNSTGWMFLYPNGSPNVSMSIELYAKFLERYPDAHDPNFLSLYQVFDCVIMMLEGMNKLLRSNPNFTVDMLAKRELQQYMNYTLFQNLGYSGMTSDPMILTENGDLAVPYAAYYYTGSYLNVTDGYQCHSIHILSWKIAYILRRLVHSPF
ncbi:hypothetical protein BCR33DRAFT_330268 [Rhizoclosmatium globosum]|uniref:Receptor ligand binding region domain-containing protein n=1 Tax=Rhizoclosmatium globosum TaxID=329046 RepID=A0A1Y2C519_9FUNG|nr:hypothetical protein BCR33DRAFT_330268 [Rhizoclosmatium globosum]|eukprot:ORY42036.1 hypothetical protein BCR33DRAFT_330268 [Rhizoclosmatium globosum]